MVTESLPPPKSSQSRKCALVLIIIFLANVMAILVLESFSLRFMKNVSIEFHKRDEYILYWLQSNKIYETALGISHPTEIQRTNIRHE